MRERDEVFDESLGRAVKVLRTERDLDRKELAERAGISYSYLAEIENGTKPASSRVLLAVAEALGIELHRMVAYAEHLSSSGPTDATASVPRAMIAAAEPAPLFAAAQPMAAGPPGPAAAPGQWFHAGRARSEITDRSAGDDELSELVDELTPEDRRVVVDLVRRLLGRP